MRARRRVRRTGAGLALVLGVTTALVGAAGSPGAAAEPVTCGGAVATIVGTDGPDDLVGTPGIDVVQLGAGDDTFRGLGGDDWICDGDGDDRIDSGPGDDWIFAGAGDDQIVTGDGDDEVRAEPGTGDDDIRTGRGHDVLFGTGGRGTRIDTGPGPDFVNATFLTGPVRLGSGNDTIHFDRTSGPLYGGPGDDLFVGFPAQPGSSIPGGPGDNTVTTSVVLGGPGKDTLQPGPGPSRVDVPRNRADWVGGRIRFHGIRQFLGSVRDDVMIGGPAAETFIALTGDDVIRGGGGDDVLIGGPGQDRAYGGPGRDRCRAEVKRSC